VSDEVADRPAPDAALHQGATAERSAKLGTFPGVYRPTVLTICGVMMYLREGWVVGNAGLGGAVLVILLTFLITGTAALSLSSITTNIRVGSGGVFSIISQSLGLETGGAIGFPLYLGQALSAALYIYGFSEAWLYIFPHHPQILVAYALFSIAFAATLISTRLAFRLQGLVLIVILISFGSIVMGLSEASARDALHQPTLWGTFEAGGFWVLFAIFFPAGTGVKVGASMSGALADPRRSIPRGTLAAVGTALCIYLFMAIWYSLVASPEELRSNTIIVVERAAVGELVLAGILASTFTAALSSLVAAPRVLQALGEQGVTPRKQFFGALTDRGEPRNAIFITGGLVALALTLGSLNRVAVLITMFFLLTYLTINVVIIIEQALGLISFRPLFRVPRWIPVIGTAACLLAIFVISPLFALIALALIVGIYAYLTTQRLETPWQTVRSSIFVSLADWAAKRIASDRNEANERSWKPDLLVPVESRTQLDGTFRFLRLLTHGKGSLTIVGIRSQKADSVDATPEYIQDDLDTLPSVARIFRDDGLYATSVTIEAPSIVRGVEMSASVLRGGYFRPNILFSLADIYDQETLQGFVDTAASYEMGAALLYRHPEAGLGHERRLNVWVSDRSPDWQLGLRLANLDLSVLLAYQLYNTWPGQRFRLCSVVSDPEQAPHGKAFLRGLIDDARLPPDAETWVRDGRFLDRLADAPPADLQILGVPQRISLDFMKEVVQKTRSSCLFVRDSGRESALA
jgi:solute carrier family 12 (potassium/chloride transporters), member 9